MGKPEAKKPFGIKL